MAFDLLWFSFSTVQQSATEKAWSWWPNRFYVVWSIYNIYIYIRIHIYTYIFDQHASFKEDEARSMLHDYDV